MRNKLARITLSLLCFSVGAGVLLASWWIAWIALYTSESWIWIFFVVFVSFGLYTLLAAAGSWRTQRGWAPKTYAWGSGLIAAVLGVVFVGDEFDLTDIGITLVLGLVFFLNWRALKQLYAIASQHGGNATKEQE